MTGDEWPWWLWVLTIGFIVAVLSWGCVEQTRCDDVDGTYLWREMKCIDVQELNP